MFLHVSVILFTGGGAWPPSMHHRSYDQGRSASRGVGSVSRGGGLHPREEGSVTRGWGLHPGGVGLHPGESTSRGGGRSASRGGASASRGSVSRGRGIRWNWESGRCASYWNAFLFYMSTCAIRFLNNLFLTTKNITSTDRPFICPITCTDSNSQCYFVILFINMSTMLGTTKVICLLCGLICR